MSLSRSPEVQALLDATVDAVIMIDQRGLVRSFNRSAERLFGYSSDEVVGRNVNLLMPERDRDHHDAYMERYRATGVPHIIGIGREIEARRKDGSVFPAFLSVGEIPGTDPPQYVGYLHDITLRRETLAAMRRERDRASAYFEGAQVILVALDRNLRVERINREGCQTLERPDREISGADWFEAFVPAEERNAARRQLLALGADGSAGREASFEHHVLTRDARRRLVAWRCTALREGSTLLGFLCSGDDITARRALELDRERARALLQEAQAIANVGNFEVYLPGSGDEFWSPQIYRIFGISDSGSGLSTVQVMAAIHAEDRARTLDTWREASRRPGRYTIEYRILRPDGATRYIRSDFESTRQPGGRLRIAGTMLDITDAKRAEQEAREAQERMTRVGRLATLGEMAAGIAHELNQPLAAIANYASAAQRLLRAPEDDEEVRLALREIDAQAQRAGEIIRRLRALFQQRTGQRERVNMADLVHETLAFCAHEARLAGIALRFDPPAESPVVLVDRVQIQQLLLNLVRNAVEAFAPDWPGERSVHIELATPATGGVRIAVSDTGPGVPPALAERIFDPFLTTKSAGTGLGLALSRSIAEAHRGRLRFEPVLPTGACFILTLPATLETET